MELFLSKELGMVAYTDLSSQDLGDREYQVWGSLVHSET